MSDLLGSASEWLQERRKALLTTPIEYHRGVDTNTVDAAVGSSVSGTGLDSRVLVDARERDYLILVEDLPYDAPLPGDQIVHDGVTFEVNNRGGDACYRFSDRNRLTFRIFTKEVS